MLSHEGGVVVVPYDMGYMWRSQDRLIRNEGNVKLLSKGTVDFLHEVALGNEYVGGDVVNGKAFFHLKILGEKRNGFMYEIFLLLV